MSTIHTLKALEPNLHSAPLVCRLRRKEVVGRRGPIPFKAEIELENVSGAPLTIEYWLTALQYLNLTVWDAAGNVISAGHYADRFSPTEEPKMLNLAPGEKFTAIISLFATAREWPVPQGTYLVQAVYEYDGLQAVSEKVDVSV